MFKRLEPTTLISPYPIKKKQLKIRRFDQKKSFLYHIKIIFQIIAIMILLGTVIFFNANESELEAVKWFLSYTQKLRKMANIRPYKTV